MKEIKAIIQPFLAEHVIAILREKPELPGMTISEVKGFGRGRTHGTASSGEAEEIFGVKKIKLEIVVPDTLAEEVVQLIVRHARTGNPGDGKIFVYPVEQTVRIRTGERMNEAT